MGKRAEEGEMGGKLGGGGVIGEKGADSRAVKVRLMTEWPRLVVI